MMKYPNIAINDEAREKLNQWTIDELVEGFRAALTKATNPRKGLRIIQSPSESGEWKSANQHIKERFEETAILEMKNSPRAIIEARMDEIEEARDRRKNKELNDGLEIK